MPREAIVVSTVEGAAGDSASDRQADLPVGCFVVLGGREAVIIPGDSEISGATRAMKRPRGIG